MRLSHKQQFFIALAAFLILGIPFKVMTLIEGFTEVRPVNAVVPLAGLICGPLGVIACGVGNLISDFFGTLNEASGIGFVSNMLGAYIPYRLWHMVSIESPNVHKVGNLLKYIWICFVAALVIAWSLGLGMYYFLGQWIEEMYTYVFFNNFGFSIVLGLPLLIMLTSPDINIQCEPRPKRCVLLKDTRARWIFSILFTLVMTCILVLIVVFQMSPVNQPVFLILSIIGIAGLIPLFL